MGLRHPALRARIVTIFEDVAGERAQANAERWRMEWEDEAFNPRLVSQNVGTLLADYLLDIFPQLHPWKNATYGLSTVLEDILWVRGTLDELAELGAVFGECETFEAFACRKADEEANPDPFHSEDPATP